MADLAAFDRPMRYIAEILENSGNLGWWRDVAIPKVQRDLIKVLSKRLHRRECDVLDVRNEAWDTLIILDACRFDQFEAINHLDGRLECRESPASHTEEFLRQNFDGRTFYDTVLVTASPQYRKDHFEFDNVFHHVVDVWAERWNESTRTVMPGDMVDTTIEASERFPDKRIVSHFMQPHYPFIGGYADRIGRHASFTKALNEARGEEPEHEIPTVWDLVRQGETTEELVWNAYNETLEIALTEVEELVAELDGLTVITSDHGNLVGERLLPITKPMYGHPIGVHMDELRVVPWFVIDSGDRRDVTSERPVQVTDYDDDTVSERLADLGYTG